MMLAVPTSAGTILSWTRRWRISGTGQSGRTCLVFFLTFPLRAMFIHVAIPGQEPGAADLPDEFKFPKMKVTEFI